MRPHTTRVPRSVSAAIMLAVLLAVTGCRGNSEAPLPFATLAAVAQAEDLRAADIDPVLDEALTHESAQVRAAAYRALGRHERTEWIGQIASGLSDADPGVRTEAVVALGQSGADARDDVLGLLEAALADERHPVVRGAIAETGGRLAAAAAPGTGERAEAILAAVSSDPGAPGRLGSDPDMIARPVQLLARGYEQLARRTGGNFPVDEAAVRVLQALSTFGRDGPGQPSGWASSGADLSSARVRRTALATLVALDRVDGGLLDDATSDPDAGVRVLAAGVVLRGSDVPDRVGLIGRLLGDQDFLVRTLGLDAHDRWSRDNQGCGALMLAAADPDGHVAVRALDLLGNARCDRVGQEQISLLESTAASLGPDLDWHRPVHAWTSLSRIAPDLARPMLSAFEGHANPFVRAYAARGAARLGDEAAVRRLAVDADANVRVAALSALAGMVGHAADDLLREALGGTHPDLVRTAAGLLSGTPDPDEAAPVLWSALESFADAGRETEWDVRRALLDRLSEVATVEDSARLRPHLRSYDRQLTEGSAALLSQWTGTAEVAVPSAPPAAPHLLPTEERLRHLHEADVVLEMERGGLIRIRLLPLLSPTNAIRFATLAESGALDGRTFHRVVPGFVIQGGSHGANEYAGEPAFTRDEVGLGSHWRGTVGLSTRGRDTGDGQLFVNLIDNLRLDHDYTIFGRVISGMDAVDRVMEGDVIQRATLETRERQETG